MSRLTPEEYDREFGTVQRVNYQADGIPLQQDEAFIEEFGKPDISGNWADDIEVIVHPDLFRYAGPIETAEHAQAVFGGPYNERKAQCPHCGKDLDV